MKRDTKMTHRFVQRTHQEMLGKCVQAFGHRSTLAILSRYDMSIMENDDEDREMAYFVNELEATNRCSLFTGDLELEIFFRMADTVAELLYAQAVRSKEERLAWNRSLVNQAL